LAAYSPKARTKPDKYGTMIRNRWLFTIAFWLFSLSFTLAQSGAADPDFMRSRGKIYVVVAVIAAIFLGIVIFLIYLDRRLTNLENQIKDDNV